MQWKRCWPRRSGTSGATSWCSRTCRSRCQGTPLSHPGCHASQPCVMHAAPKPLHHPCHVLDIRSASAVHVIGRLCAGKLGRRTPHPAWQGHRHSQESRSCWRLNRWRTRWSARRSSSSGCSSRSRRPTATRPTRGPWRSCWLRNAPSRRGEAYLGRKKGFCLQGSCPEHGLSFLRGARVGTLRSIESGIQSEDRERIVLGRLQEYVPGVICMAVPPNGK